MMTLIEQMDRLTFRDKKSLSQKGLKASEEVGELAKAILPYEGAHGTQHRVPCVDKIGEECADMFLVAYSIMRSIGMDLAAITRMVQRKTDCWELLLDNEDRTDCDNLDFEMHITVESATSIDEFAATCREIGVKPIVLDLYGRGEVNDVMTSSTFRGSTKAAVDHARDLSRALQARGYTVLREKIETVPWHPAAQKRVEKTPAYFEAHFAFDTPFPALLRAFCRDHDIHLSRNMMKKGRESVSMGTYRVDATLTTASQFQAKVRTIREMAEEAGHRVVKTPHTEYALHDTNERHDREWITA